MDKPNEAREENKRRVHLTICERLKPHTNCRYKYQNNKTVKQCTNTQEALQLEYFPFLRSWFKTKNVNSNFKRKLSFVRN